MSPVALLLGLSAPAQASRPTDLVGLYSFEAEDVIESTDGETGLVRVHYSVEGPNLVRQGDDDEIWGGDGIPDFAQEVAATAEEVLLAYEALGLRLPLKESEMGLGELGGSDALDFYLVDFDHTGDGQFGTDVCKGGVCSGYMTMENDFTAYGYSNISLAIRVLTSHELFHGVQFAYLDDMPGWMSEGTAMWSEYYFDPDSNDFIGWCGKYIEEPDRGLDRPPAGSTAWNYGTGLFFGFLDVFFGPDTIVDLMDQMAEEGGEGAYAALDTTIQDAGSTIEEIWTTFGSYNLATGKRAGLIEGYPFAEDLDEIEAAHEGETITDDERVYPLATVYLYLDHPGGELWFGTPDEPAGLALRIHPSTGGQRAPVEEELGTWWPDAPGATLLGDFEAGGYWVLFSQPAFADSSIAFDYCLGSSDTMADCSLPVEVEDTGTEPEPEPGAEGCACSSSGRLIGWALVLPALVGLWRRRPPSPKERPCDPSSSRPCSSPPA